MILQRLSSLGQQPLQYQNPPIKSQHPNYSIWTNPTRSRGYRPSRTPPSQPQNGTVSVPPSTSNHSSRIDSSTLTQETYRVTHPPLIQEIPQNIVPVNSPSKSQESTPATLPPGDKSSTKSNPINEAASTGTADGPAKTEEIKSQLSPMGKSPTKRMLPNNRQSTQTSPKDFLVQDEISTQRH
jgi:hypothetical protein